MTHSAIWLTIIVAGIAAFALRLSFFALPERFDLPRLLLRALRFVPAAMLSALTLPALLYPGGDYSLFSLDERLLAGFIAAIVAWRTGSVLLTIGVGMASLWVFQTVI